VLQQRLGHLVYEQLAVVEYGGELKIKIGSSQDLLRQLSYDSSLSADQRLQQAALAQLAIFVVEYALAQLLLSWGIRPQALLGHGVGEYVVACIAKVLTLDDALRLVIRYTRLLRLSHIGATLIVELPAAELHSLLGGDIRLVSSDSPARCTVVGAPSAVDALEQALAARNISCHRPDPADLAAPLLPDSALDALHNLADTLSLEPPRIPYISSVTGTWISDQQATSPDYWAQHPWQTFRFADGVQTLLGQPERAILDVGAEVSLIPLVLQNGADADLVMSLLPGAQAAVPCQAALLHTLGKLWLLGVPNDWEGFYHNQRRYRLPLPTYPFDRERCWIEPNASQ
jgi:acyl transferase domain-containing protein